MALTRLGLWPTLLIGAVVASASHLMLAWLALAGARLDLLTLAISVENFASGFAGSALIAYMSGLTSPGFAATQYALLSSLYALPGKFIGGFSGAVVDRWGYPALFTATALIALPLVVLCFIVRRDTMQAKERSRIRSRRTGGSGLRARPAQIASVRTDPAPAESGGRDPRPGRAAARRHSHGGRQRLSVPQISLRLIPCPPLVPSAPATTSSSSTARPSSSGPISSRSTRTRSTISALGRAADRRRAAVLHQARCNSSATARPGIKPTHLAIIFDKSEDSFRKEIYPDYKGHRPDAAGRPDAADAADARGGARLRAGRRSSRSATRPTTSSPPTRARPRRAARTCIIVSSDKDLMQLVGPLVRFYDFESGAKGKPGYRPERNLDEAAVDREVRGPAAGPDRRRAGADRRHLRQRAGRARHRPQDRRAAHQGISATSKRCWRARARSSSRSAARR